MVGVIKHLKVPKLIVSQIKTVEEIKNGNFKVPAPKKLTTQPSTNDFVPLAPADDSDLPF